MSSGQQFCEIGEGLLGAERKALLEMSSRLARLAASDPSAMSREDLADMVVSLSSAGEHVSVMAGRFMDLGEATTASLTKGEKSMVALVSTGSRVSRSRAQQMARSGSIIHRFTHFHGALMDARITTGHIDVLVWAANQANSDQFLFCERELVAMAVLCTPEEFRDQMRVWVAAADPTEHLHEFLEAQARRHLVYGKDLFGNVHFSGTFEPLTGEQVINAVEDRKQQLVAEGGATNSAGTVDALVDLVLGDSAGVAHIEVIAPEPVGDEWLTEGTDEDVEPVERSEAELCRRAEGEAFRHWYSYMTNRCGRGSFLVPPMPVVGDIGFRSVIYPRTAGGTLVPPQIVGEMARKGRVRRHLIDSDGDLVADAPGGRHFTVAQKRLIGLRDNHCQHPGCRVPARWSEHDHIEPHDKQGPTLVANGQLMCKFHHRFKHRNDPGPNRPTHYDNTPVILRE